MTKIIKLSYISRIIVDERTLNRMVFTYNTLTTQNQIHDLLEEVSGEKTERKYVSHVERVG